MKACIILHNKIVEDEAESGEVLDYRYESSPITPLVDSTPVDFSREPSDSFEYFVQKSLEIKDRLENQKLKASLIEEQYKFSGQQSL